MNVLLATRSVAVWPAWSVPVAAGALGYALLLFSNPVFPSLRNGLRALRRYPRIFWWFGGLSAAYWAFQTVVAGQLGELPVGIAGVWDPSTLRLPDAAQAAARAWRPALDSLAGLFQQAVATYPVSAVGALLFLTNWRGVHTAVLTEARRRLPRAWLPAYGLLLCCALAALLKPVLALAIHPLNDVFGGIELLRTGALLDALSFQFEALLGTFVQVYVILLAYAWLRGFGAEPERLFAFAVKRAVVAARWTGALLLAGLLFVHVPLLASYVSIAAHTDFTNAVVRYVEQTARPLLALALILFASVQLCLVFHNESLGGALRQHAAFVRSHWYRVLWFLLVAAIHFFLLAWSRELTAGAYPDFSWPERVLSLAFSQVRALLSAWLVASWVCLYRDCSQAGREVAF